MSPRFHPRLMSRHAVREARREHIDLELIALAYEDPDDVRSSDHDDLREIRTRWAGSEGVAVVMDTDDLRVVTVWRTGQG